MFCPIKANYFQVIVFHAKFVCRRIDDISAELVVTLRDKINQFKVYSLTFYEGTDISDTSQLVIFIHCVNDSFQVTEEMKIC